MVSKVIYKGDLRTESTHLQSNTTIVNDAPVDNQGKGEAFSPTDLLANSLATCMFTIMGIKARDNQWSIENSVAEVTKIMVADPRRIGEIHIKFQMQGVTEAKDQTILERAAMTCPVMMSLHPDIQKKITFEWK